MKRTKIVATLGPSTAKKETLKKMFLAGLNVCRLNFSHGGYEAHIESIKNIRELNEEMALNVAILADLQGPKIRTHEMQNNGVLLEKSQPKKFLVQPNTFQSITSNYRKMLTLVNAFCSTMENWL